jgi:hypothetical protein
MHHVSQIDVLSSEVGELGQLVLEEQIRLAGWAVAVLGDVNFGYVLALSLRIIHLLTIDKHHNIRILFN